MLADGVQGMLSGAAVEHFGLRAREPADLRARGQGGVARRAPARPRRAHARLAAQAGRRATASSAARSPTRWAPTRSASGSSSASTTPDASLSVHDLLQERQEPPALPRDARGRRARRLGRQGDPRGRLLVAAGERVAARRRDPRRRRGLRQRAAPEGRPLRPAQRHARRPRRSTARSPHGADLSAAGALSQYDAQVANSEIYHDLHRYRNMRQAFQHGLIVGGALGGAMDTLRGDLPPWRLAHASRLRAAGVRQRPDVRRARRTADVRQALVGLRQRQPQPRRPARPSAHPAAGAPRARHRLGATSARRRSTRSEQRARTASSSSR